MRKNILHTIFIIIIAVCSNTFYSQVYVDTSVMNVIHNNRTAYEGDMYLDTINNVFRIGLTNGKLGYIGDNQQLDSIKLIGDSALAVYLERGGADTISLSSLGDKDWYKIGTTNSANSINDSIYTNGEVRITNYPETRGDDTTTHLNILYTDINGNIKSARREIIPPPVALDISVSSTGNTFNYYNHYATQLTNMGLTPIPLAKLDFYVSYYDNLIFSNVSINATGVLTYDVTTSSPSDNRIIYVVFYTK